MLSNNMKKSLIILAAAALVLAACAPLSLVVNTEHDGTRLMVTSNQRLFNYKGGTISAALGVKCTPKDTLLAILITSDEDTKSGIFDKGDKIMIRFDDQSVIEIENIYDKEVEKETTTTTTTDYHNSWNYAYSPWCTPYFWGPYDAYAFVPSVRTTTTTTSTSYALYPLNYQQIAKLRDRTIIKFRVETANQDLDMPEPQEASEVFHDLGNFLYESYLTKAVQRTKF